MFRGPALRLRRTKVKRRRREVPAKVSVHGVDRENSPGTVVARKATAWYVRADPG